MCVSLPWVTSERPCICFSEGGSPSHFRALTPSGVGAFSSSQLFESMSHCNPSVAVPGGVTPPFKYISSSPAKPGASGLIALPYNAFGVIRAYRDSKGFAWFVLGDVFKTLGVPGGTSGSRKRIKDPLDLSTVRLWVPNTVNPQASGYREVQTLSEGGMHAMLAASPLSNRADMRRWMTSTAVPILRAL